MFNNKRKRPLYDSPSPKPLDYDSDDSPSPKRLVIDTDYDSDSDDSPRQETIIIDSDSDSDNSPRQETIIIDFDSDSDLSDQLNDYIHTSTLQKYTEQHPIPDSDWEDTLSFLSEDNLSSQSSEANSPHNFPPPSTSTNSTLIEVDHTQNRMLFKFEDSAFFTQSLNSVFHENTHVTMVKSGDILPPPPPRPPTPPTPTISQNQKNLLNQLAIQQKAKYKLQHKKIPPPRKKKKEKPLPTPQPHYPIPEYPTPDVITSAYLFSYIQYVGGCVNNMHLINNNYFPNDSKLYMLVMTINEEIKDSPSNNIYMLSCRKNIMIHLKERYFDVYPCEEISNLTSRYPYNLMDPIFYLHEPGLSEMVEKIKIKVYRYKQPESDNLTVQNIRFTNMSILTVKLNIEYRKIYNLPPIPNT